MGWLEPGLAACDFREMAGGQLDWFLGLEAVGAEDAFDVGGVQGAQSWVGQSSIDANSLRQRVSISMAG